VEGSCGCYNGPSGSIKCWETIEWLCQLVASRVVLRVAQNDLCLIEVRVSWHQATRRDIPVDVSSMFTARMLQIAGFRSVV
jgi:hypothetical protein